MRGNRDEPRVHRAVDVAVLALVWLVLGVHLPAHLLLAPTVTAGGDTPSHYYTLQYLVSTLLPSGRLSGWSPHSYAGFPILELYFPLPFLLMAALSAVVALPVAFKLGTVLGIFLLPPAAYVCLRLLRVPFPGPALAAIGTLPFLFSEATSMWGGNIPSVLAGEFAYSAGLALLTGWIGLLYAGMTTGRYAVANAMLLALIGLSHGYPLLMAGALSLVLLFHRRAWPERLAYFGRLHLHAGLLMSVWLLPLLAHLPWTTPYNFTWQGISLKQVLPAMLVPQGVLAAYAVGRAVWRTVKRRAREPVLWYLLAVGGWGLLLYAVAPALGVVDVRFIPFVHLAIVLLAPLGLLALTRRLRGQWVVPLVVFAGTAWWVATQVRYIPQWIAWNYQGFEAKPRWPLYAQINEYLKGTPQDPRVAYEHSTQHDVFGSTRAWEMLPVFSGRATLEHAYLQASASSPFVFYLQSEISKETSCPFPQYGCTAVDVARAQRHLELFNVRDVIVVTPELKTAFAAHPAYRLAFEAAPYAIYATPGPHAYVTVLAHEPVLWTGGGDWKQTAYAWFRNARINDVHLVFSIRQGPRRNARVRLTTDDLAHVPREPVRSRGRVVWERVTEQEIVFETTALQQPHLIKVSYHPNWRAQGAEGIELVSPSLMLVYPTHSRVRLIFSRGLPAQVGMLLTVLGIGFPWLLRYGKATRAWTQIARVWRPLIAHRLVPPVMMGLMAVAVGGLLIPAGWGRATAPDLLLGRAIRAKDRQRWHQAEALYRLILTHAPQSGAAQQAQYYLGIMPYRQQHWDEAIQAFGRFLAAYPDSRMAAEVVYHLGLCYEQVGRRDDVRLMAERLEKEFGGTTWARYARERWSRSSGR